jgi:hypothetical protein
MLDLTMVVPEGHERQAAAQLRSQMTDRVWTQMVALAAEIVTLQEQVATGQVFLVAPVEREHLAAVVRYRSGRPESAA